MQGVGGVVCFLLFFGVFFVFFFVVFFAFCSHLTIDVVWTSIVKCEPKAEENEVHMP